MIAVNEWSKKREDAHMYIHICTQIVSRNIDLLVYEAQKTEFCHNNRWSPSAVEHRTAGENYEHCSQCMTPFVSL